LSAATRSARAAIDLLLPPVCLGCADAGVGGRALCLACADELRWNRCACPRCALPLPAPAPLCGRCLRRPPPFVRAAAPLLYADPVDRWLGALKFRNGLPAGRLLGELLVDGLDPDWLDGVDAVLPMPLHRARLRERGYNQAVELLRPLQRRHRLPLLLDGLHRERDTPHQLGLDAATRRRNLRGAFRGAPALAGRCVLLFDDVITTGSTVVEATRALLAAGAAEVRVLAVARAAGR
jgi:ComF family protein